ncbi:hypothetical protein [Paenibacillus humicus]|uniref:hypothetical protein n=1 Tax=Paenibacillus humicus TaxID=412861 RepID=UPI003F13BC96
MIWRAGSDSRRRALHLSNDRGSSLLLVVFLILLLTMLGVAVLGAALGGAMRTERSEENVQSLHLAQKGLDEAIAAIYERFNNRTIDPDDLGNQLTSFTKSFNEQLGDMKGGSKLDAAAPPFYQVVSVRCTKEEEGSGRCLPPGSGGAAADYQYSLTVTAEAQVDGALRRLQQVIVLDTYPDFLKYAFGSEGLLTVHGAPYFMGNLYAGQGLRMNDAAEFIYQSVERTQKSQFMYLKPKLGVNGNPVDGSGRLITGNPQNLYYGYGPTYGSGVPGGYIPFYDKSLNGTITSAEKAVTHGLADVIDPMPAQKFVSIDVLSSFLDKVGDSLGDRSARGELAYRQDRTVIQNVYAAGQAPGLVTKLRKDYAGSYEDLKSMPPLPLEPVMPDILLQPPPQEPNPAPDAGDAAEGGTGTGIPVAEAPADPAWDEYEAALAEYQQMLETYNQEMDDYNRKIDVLGGKLATIGMRTETVKRPSSAIIDGPLVLGPNLKSIDFANKGRSNWLIVNGDLILQGNKEDAADKLRLRGNLLVTGNVEISGQVDVDATILALGRTDIRDAAIRGLKLSGDTSKRELVLIGLGPIRLYRVDSFQRLDEQGYDSAAERERQVLDAFLYTDSSASLYGVGSAFWLNGGFFSKGNLTLNATLGSTTENAAEGRLIFAEQSGLNEKQARFIIEYNDQVFAHQNVALPRVNKVRLTTGPLKLLKH